MFDTADFRSIVESFHERMSSLPMGLADRKPKPDAWSLKEIIGHLIDSAANNHLRFVRLQLSDLESTYPGYDAEPWVGLQAYNQADWNNLMDLWYRYNLHLLHVIEHIDPKTIGRVWRREKETLTLEFLVKDYYRHLVWHREHFEKRLEEITGG